MQTQKDIHKISTTSPLVYTNMGWLGTAPTEGRVARPERRWGCRRGTPKNEWRRPTGRLTTQLGWLGM